MILNEVLIEKYKVQKKLSENSTDMHDYFEKTHKTAEYLSQKYGVVLRYQSLPNKSLNWTSKSGHPKMEAHS